MLSQSMCSWPKILNISREGLHSHSEEWSRGRCNAKWLCVSMMKNDAMSQKKRKPRGCEVEEMAKALTIKFPNLSYAADKNQRICK